MTEPKRPPTPEQIAQATDLSGLDLELFEHEPTPRSFDAVEAMSEEEFLTFAEEALSHLTEEQREMLQRNR